MDDEKSEEKVGSENESAAKVQTVQIVEDTCLEKNSFLNNVEEEEIPDPDEIIFEGAFLENYICNSNNSQCRKERSTEVVESSEEKIDSIIEKGQTKIDDVRQKLENLLIKCDTENESGEEEIQTFELVEDTKPEEINFLKNEDLSKPTSTRKRRSRKRNKKDKQKLDIEDADDIIIEEVVVENSKTVVDNVQFRKSKISGIEKKLAPSTETNISSQNKKSANVESYVKDSSRKSRKKRSDSIQNNSNDDKPSTSTPRKSRSCSNPKFNSNDEKPPKRTPKTQSSSAYAKDNSSNVNKHNSRDIPITYAPESLLLMRLLFLTPIDREYHLMDEAKRLGFLVPSRLSSEYVLNHSLTPLYEDPSWMFKCKNVQEFQDFLNKKSSSDVQLNYDVELTVATLYPHINSTTNHSNNSITNAWDIKNTRSSTSRKDDAQSKKKNDRKREMEKRAKRETFPTQLYKFLKDHEPDSTFSKITEFQDFNEPESQNIIETYAKMLVEKNVGYIIEGRIH